MKIDIDDFLKDFDKRFNSFITASPLQMLFTVTPSYVELHIRREEGGKSILIPERFMFDFMLDVKENIYIIKQFLIENYYPRFMREVITYEEVSPEKKLALLEKGEISVEDIASYKKEVVTQEVYTLLRVLNKQRVLHLLKGEDVYACELSCPLTYFKVSLIDNPKKAQEMFQKNISKIEKLERKIQ